MDLDDLAPLLDAAAPPRVLSRQHAHRLGYSDAALLHQVGTGRWRRVLPHTYLTSNTLTWDDRLCAAVAFAGEGALLSGAAALCDRGLRSVQRPRSILVLVPADRAPRSTGWVRVRPSARPVARAPVPGTPRAADARSVTDMAVEQRRLDDVRALVAEVVRREFCTVDELVAELRHVPRRGSAHLRAAIDEVGGGAWSAPEARAATLMRRAGLPSFEQNVRVDLSNGKHVYVDFVWRELRAVLEIDSDTHHAMTGDADRTSDRHLWLETDGYSVIHRTPRYVVKTPQVFVRGIDAWLTARALQLAS